MDFEYHNDSYNMTSSEHVGTSLSIEYGLVDDKFEKKYKHVEHVCVFPM